MRKIQATVVYSMDVEVDVPDDCTNEELHNKICDAAQDAFEDGHYDVLTHSCSEPNLEN